MYKPRRLPFAAEVDKVWEACGLVKLQRAVGDGLWLRNENDIRTLLIIGFFYFAQVARWRATSETVAAFDNALFGCGDELWIAALCLFSFFGATITHNCIHVPMFKRTPYDVLNKTWQVRFLFAVQLFTAIFPHRC